MIARGMTQYLAAAQGMLSEVETAFQKQITRFIWNKKCSLVNEKTLQKPRKKGDLNILNIKTRNEVIDIM